MKLDFKKILEKIKKPFNQGLTSLEIINATLVSVLFTIIPMFGVTTALLTFFSVKLKLNLPIMLIISYASSPLQFLFFLKFIHVGENVFGVKHTLLTFHDIKNAFDESFLTTIKQLFLELLCGLGGWLLIALPLFFILFYLNKKIHQFILKNEPH